LRSLKPPIILSAILLKEGLQTVLKILDKLGQHPDEARVFLE